MASLWEMLVPGLGAAIQKGLDLIPDSNARAQAEEAFRQASQSAEVQEMLAQIEVNKVEANSGSLFQGGARPFILWVCGAALAWTYILAPLLTWGSAMFGGPAMPALAAGELFPLMTGMLGLAAVRTYERTQGVAAGQGPASRAAAVGKKA